MAEGGRGLEPHDGSLAKVTCRDDWILDPGEVDQPGQMVQDHLWEVEVARHRTWEALDMGSLDAAQHVVLAGECPHAARTG